MSKTAMRLIPGVMAVFVFGGAYAIPAKAADLGGDCCADLEERVAELEATTVRKGNRKVSVTIYGHVDKAVMYWDDGDEQNTYVVDNDHNSTRFGFKGKAKISKNWSAGYKIEIEVDAANSSAEQDQRNDNAGGGPSLRHSFLYLKSQYGKVSLGLTSGATDDITHKAFVGKNTNATRPDFHWNRDFFLRPQGAQGNGGLAGEQIGSLCGDSFDADACFDSTGRQQVVRYDTPEVGGFHGAVAWGEDDFWDVMGGWKGKAGDFKAAFRVGYRHTTDERRSGGAGGGTTAGLEEDSVAGSAGIMHTPTGLYVQGAYRWTEIDINPLTAAYNDGTSLPESTAWYIQAGIQQKWNSLGKTTVWGEYARVEDGFIGECVGERFDPGAGAPDVCDNGTDYGFANANQLASSELERWGVGITQAVDSAAMELYLLYQHTEAEITLKDGFKGNFEDFDNVVAGAIIKF